MALPSHGTEGGSSVRTCKAHYAPVRRTITLVEPANQQPGAVAPNSAAVLKQEFRQDRGPRFVGLIPNLA